jgi:PKD repeat protein
LAVLSVSPSSGRVGRTVFWADGCSSQSPVSFGIRTWEFDWGDGSRTGPCSSCTASHTYSGVGAWTVRLNVCNYNNRCSGFQSPQTVNVTANSPPVARITTRPNPSLPLLAVTADASGSSDPDGWITSYCFDWGDGSAPTCGGSSSATHAYLLQGNYGVTVTVTDNDGATAQAGTTQRVCLAC